MPKHRPNHAARLNAPRPMCSGKRSYLHKAEAELVAQEQQVIDPSLHLAVYRCLKGKHWHLTRREGQSEDI